MTTRRDERGSWAVTATDAEDERRGIERVGAREGIFSAREETRAEARARVEATLESFDERLARARARAEEARVDAERIERLLSESGRFRGGGQSDAATSRDEGRARRSTGAAISPERQSLHRPTPRWGLGASVDGTEWTTHRGPSRTFGEFGRGDRHSDVSVGSDEDGRSAFRAPRAVPVIRADRDIIPQGLSTPPRMRVRAEPPAPVRRRTRSVDLTTHPPFPSDLTQRVHTSVEIETSRVSTNSLLEAVANEAEFERLRRSSVEDDDQPVETKPRMP
ncbi:unnamed product [Ostreococcus tauri]|uniref:Unnamed product n=1 Tax=Ostreococcus tauri TaxID=70448 RepID=Q014P2_OSTTA|nr:unnamed product [Ostreococcus tauri]CAL54637.1 unnamed product [Ostreococcus tauri]|eukprot:XP_003080470.1 unnamed product [Ostreococcus tauri]